MNINSVITSVQCQQFKIRLSVKSSKFHNLLKFLQNYSKEEKIPKVSKPYQYQSLFVHLHPLLSIFYSVLLIKTENSLKKQ